jgi:hypothetical protein
MQGISVDTVICLPYIELAMFTKITTYFLLTAIAIQGIFGGLQDSVSICLGGGHEHEVAATVEHCELECSHHSEFVTPATSEEHIEDCDCTDFELGLIVLLSTPRVHDDAMLLSPSLSFASFATQVNSQHWRDSPQREVDIGMMQRIAVIQSTRLRV